MRRAARPLWALGPVAAAMSGVGRLRVVHQAPEDEMDAADASLPTTPGGSSSAGGPLETDETSTPVVVVPHQKTRPQLEERIATLKREFQTKKADIELRTAWEARRLQQIFKEVEREMLLQRESACAAETARIQSLSDAAVAELVEELAVARETVLQQTRRELLGNVEARLETLARDLEARKDAEVAAIRAAVEDDTDRRLAGLAETARAASSASPEPEVAALELEVEACLARVRLKAREHDRQASAHRRSSAALLAAQALEGRAPVLDEAVHAAFESSGHDDIVRVALASVPPDRRALGVPEVSHLEDRWVSRVEAAAERWLLVPKDLDGVLGHALAYLAHVLGLSAPLIDTALDEASSKSTNSVDNSPRRHMATLRAAEAALVHSGDLATCVARLETLPATNHNGEPNPCRDWLDDAKARLAAGQAAALLRTKVALINADQIAPCVHHDASK
mmetsp:Transcript_23521/g.93228  ORF Transcript_23521/g.93228 Transcript_23521/m.93228 type:complete len:454 (+) Transcript_23521:32-1393(+)